MVQQIRKKQSGIARRRQFQRAQVDLRNSYSIIEEDCIRQGYARIVDLSAGGVRMLSATEFVQGSQVSLRFALPDGQREVYVNGRIVMSFFDGLTQCYSHSTAFTRISRADQDAIRRYVDDVRVGNTRLVRPSQDAGNTIRECT